MKFTLRDLFWLTLVMALATGWAMHARQARIRAKDQRDELNTARSRAQVDETLLRSLLEKQGQRIVIDANGDRTIVDKE